MTSPGAAEDATAGRSSAERRLAISARVDAELRAALGIGPDEELDAAQNYFDLGMTSLGIAEIKQKLESHLGVEVSETDFYNNPTVGLLRAHLAEVAAPTA